MNQITLQFTDQTGLYHFLENIAEAQNSIVEAGQSNGFTEERQFAQQALALIVSQTAKQLVQFQQAQ